MLLIINSETLLVEKNDKAVKVIVEFDFMASPLIFGVLAMLDSCFCYGWKCYASFGYILVSVFNTYLNLKQCKNYF